MTTYTPFHQWIEATPTADTVILAFGGWWDADAAATAVLTGTATATINESDVETGGKTVIVTLTNDTWAASGSAFNAERQGIIDGLTSAQSEATGWNAEVRDKEVVGSLARTSDTVATLTLSAASSYFITAQETITHTIPASALVTSSIDVVAAPTFTVDDEVPREGVEWTLGGTLPHWTLKSARPHFTIPSAKSHWTINKA